ncbi:MDM38 [Auxenochlorella protothecoides x Auxenochlorella symbiontica]
MGSARRGGELALLACRALLRRRAPSAAGECQAWIGSAPRWGSPAFQVAGTMRDVLAPGPAWLHTSSWAAQQGLGQTPQQGLPAPTPPGVPPPGPLPGAGTPPPGAGAAHLPPSPAAKPAANDADECDEVMEDLAETRRRVRALNRPAPGEVSLSKRARKLAGVAVGAVRATAVFVLSVPSRLAAFAALPGEEKRAAALRGWQVVKREAKHYWIGTKLLGADMRIASRLCLRVLRGRTLTRRERTQLTRTTADIFRLVPMLVFVVVPFMELLLPVALRLFPNMLPSTFEDKLKKEEELKRSITARLEIARFLQDTVSEMAEAEMERGGTEEVRTSAADLYQFMQKVRAGAPVSTAELLRFAKLFNDELTLDNLVRVQLVSLCRFVGITPYGTDAFLRTRLRRHLQQIKADDRDIQAEGLASLSEDELRGACRARGMRAPFGEGAADFMRAQLAEWLDWSLNRSLPSSLLLLSRAFTVTSPLSGGRRGVDEDMLRSTLGSLPDEVVEDVELFATRDGDDKTEAYERKLELLEREEEMIKEEEEAAVAAETPITSGAQTAQELTAAVAAAAVVREAAASAMVDVLEGVSEEEKAAKYAEARRSKMRKVVNALAALASSSGVAGERTAFMELVEKEIGRLESNLTKRGGGMVFTRGALASSRQAALEGMVGESRLADKVASILGRVEAELDAADAHIGNRLHVLDLDQDGVISVEELQTALSFLREQVGEEELRHMLQVLSREAGTDGAIDVNKLMEMAKREDDEDDDK